jgi:hypothetical protein
MPSTPLFSAGDIHRKNTYIGPDDNISFQDKNTLSIVFKFVPRLRLFGQEAFDRFQVVPPVTCSIKRRKSNKSPRKDSMESLWNFSATIISWTIAI